VLPLQEAKGSYRVSCTSIWLPAEAALSISNIRFLLKSFLEGIREKQRIFLQMPCPKITRNVYIEKIPSVVQKIMMSQTDITLLMYMFLIRQTPRHIQPPVQWVPGLFPGDKVTGVWH
jgi:hypothetical protein